MLGSSVVGGGKDGDTSRDDDDVVAIYEFCLKLENLKSIARSVGHKVCCMS